MENYKDMDFKTFILEVVKPEFTDQQKTLIELFEIVQNQPKGKICHMTVCPFEPITGGVITTPLITDKTWAIDCGKAPSHGTISLANLCHSVVTDEKEKFATGGYLSDIKLS